MRTDHVVGTLDQQGTQIDVARLGDAELWVAIPGLTAFWPQTEVAADIAAGLRASQWSSCRVASSHDFVMPKDARIAVLDLSARASNNP